MNQKFTDYLFETKVATRQDELFASYTRFIDAYGFDRLGVSALAGSYKFEDLVEKGLFIDQSLNGWAEHYHEQNYIEDDYIAQLSWLRPTIANWKDVSEQVDLSSKQLAIMRDANNFGLHSGTTISVHTPRLNGALGGDRTAYALASSQPKLSLEPLAFEIINLASYQMHLCYFSLDEKNNSSNRIDFTEVELEILKWVSSGLTQSVIADRINKSPHTVNYHMRAILKKTQAKNVTEALMMAIKEGVIGF